MKKLLLICFTLPTVLILHAQVQMGGDIDGEAMNDESGNSVSLSGDGLTIAIGSSKSDGNSSGAGQTRVYEWQGSDWTQKGTNINGENVNDHSGTSVSLSQDGNTVAIGAPDNDGNGSKSGHVRIYNWNGAAWGQVGADIDGETAYDMSGSAVSISNDGNTVAIGAPNNDDNGSLSGHTRVFEWNGNAWVQLGLDIDGEAGNDHSGSAISLNGDGTILSVGATGNDGNGAQSGHTRVFKWDGNSWNQRGADIDGEAAQDLSGASVSLSSAGDFVAIGATYNDGTATNAGHVRIFQWNGSAWIQVGADIDGEASKDFSGNAVCINADGNVVAIGAKSNDEAGTSAGHVRLFQWDGNAWLQVGNDIDGENSGDGNGYAVSLNNDGSIVACGAIFNDDNGSNAGHVRVFQLSSLCATTSTVNPSLCGSYTAPSGDETYTISGAYTDTIQNAAGCDSVISIHLTINQPTTSTDVLTACESYTWIDGNIYTSDNNTATDTLINVAGCDSVITLDLTINDAPDVTTTQSDNSLSASASGVSYQWIDCDNGNINITGATNQTYTATSDGSYAVIVSNANCSDTSECMEVNTVGLSENSSIKGLLVYPNPIKSTVTITVQNMQEEYYTLSILDATGRTLLTQTMESNSTKIDLNSFKKGVYFIRISTDGKESIQKVTKE